MKTGIQLIAQERKEQIEKHNWSLDHDDEHDSGELAVIAATLAVAHTDACVVDPLERGTGDNCWGLEEKLKDDNIHRLKVAGALIAAELDRINTEN